ncbi:dTDP-4-dehydrorhamnose reductase [Gottfriedia luciferensis]|uniref:dTDP-4-dehydrorhamnose reductase n=1 Tax=Gottfriedia luciferensis TaxID=178774 RepID=A0ABX2ZK56_9BACI|nr:dTDP-4-dehydrorhamnose reductase [Gottfriedia luciferensis]ODG90091.1 dTDP-4-dehydrorhamnose reductase [Gottfriedia luciferensis]
MKVLVTGYGGQLGFDVVRECERHGLNVKGYNRQELDITNRESVFSLVDSYEPDVIIHCAAYTAVDKAEDDKENCWNVNVEGTRYLVEAAKNHHSKFIYISTDYVFNGKGESPFNEDDQPDPIGYYGLTKYEGEKVVQSLIENYFIIRISWVFGVNGNNFIKTMLRLSETRDELNIVGDQIGSPTYTVDLARLIVDLIKTDNYGIYHATNDGYTSWANFAKEIFKQTNSKTFVKSIASEDYPTRASRPKNSRLLKQKLVENGFQSLPSWQDALARYLVQLNKRDEVQ